MNVGNVVLGVVLGMAAGAVLGVLFAPARGSATRTQLSKQAARYTGTIKDSAGEFIDALEGTFDSAKETAGGLADRVSGAMDSLHGSETRKSTRRT